MGTATSAPLDCNLVVPDGKTRSTELSSADQATELLVPLLPPPPPPLGLEESSISHVVSCVLSAGNSSWAVDLSLPAPNPGVVGSELRAEYKRVMDERKCEESLVIEDFTAMFDKVRLAAEERLQKLTTSGASGSTSVQASDEEAKSLAVATITQPWLMARRFAVCYHEQRVEFDAKTSVSVGGWLCVKLASLRTEVSVTIRV